MLKSGYQLIGKKKKKFFDLLVCVHSILDAEKRTMVYNVSCTKHSPFYSQYIGFLCLSPVCLYIYPFIYPFNKTNIFGYLFCAIHHATCWGYGRMQNINGPLLLEPAICQKGWALNKHIWEMKSVLRRKGEQNSMKHLTKKSNLVWGEKGQECQKSVNLDLKESVRRGMWV